MSALLSTSVTLGLLCGLQSSLLAANYRAGKLDAVTSWQLVLLNSVVGGFLLLPGIPPATLLAFELSNYNTLLLLLLSSLLWTFMVVWDARSFSTIDVSTNAVLKSGRLILLGIIGIVCFGETSSPLFLLGAATVISSILISMRERKIARSPGLNFQLASIVAGTAAITVDKFLTYRLDYHVVLIAGYLLPTVWTILLKPSLLLSISSFIRTRYILIILSSALYAGVGYCLVRGLAEGEMHRTVLYQQSAIIFSFFIGVFGFGERDNVLRQSLSMVCALIGTILILEA